MLVSVIGEVIVPRTPSNVTLVAPVNPIPLTTTDVPPLLAPVEGVTLVTLLPYVNRSSPEVGDVWSDAGKSGLVTLTSTEPVAAAGEVTTSAVEPVKQVVVALHWMGAAAPN
jgi:hypothetical protein